MSKKLLKATTILGLAAAALMSSTATAKEAGDLLVRARAVAVIPDENATTSIGGNVEIDNSVVPELDFTYFVTDNIGVELILGTTKHHPKAVGTALGDVELGSVWLLPPTLTLQYHFNPKGDVSPYVGAGVNYTIFYSEKEPAAVVTDIDYSNSFGFALQAGVDVKISEDWYLNLDVKRVWLNTDVKINGGAVTADVDVNPWLFGVGFGTTF